MTEKRGFRQRVLRAFFLSRFEPMETILAISAILHGLWLTFPEWQLVIDTANPVVEGGSRYGELFIGIFLLFAGLLHLFTIIIDSKKRRKLITLWQFMMWVFITMLAYSTSGASGVIWLAYGTIMLFSGIVYLNISLGADKR